MSPLFTEVHFPILFSLSPAPLGSLMSLMRCSLPCSHQSLSVQGFLPVPAAGHLLGGSAVPKGRMLPCCCAQPRAACPAAHRSSIRPSVQGEAVEQGDAHLALGNSCQMQGKQQQTCPTAEGGWRSRL